jgi:hypothetical protein
MLLARYSLRKPAESCLRRSSSSIDIDRNCWLRRDVRSLDLSQRRATGEGTFLLMTGVPCVVGFGFSSPGTARIGRLAAQAHERRRHPTTTFGALISGLSQINGTYDLVRLRSAISVRSRSVVRKVQ